MLNLREPSSNARGYAVACISSILAVALTIAMWPPWRSHVGAIPFLFLTAAVFGSAWYYGLGPGLLATVMTAIGQAYLLTPMDTIVIQETGDIRSWIIYVVFCVVMSILCGHRKADAERLRFLASANTSLGSSLDFEIVLETSAGIVVPWLCNFCIIYLTPNSGEVQRVFSLHDDDTKAELARRLCFHLPDMARDHALARTLRTGAAEIKNDINNGYLVATSGGPEELRLKHELAISARLITPLVAHGRVIGALVLHRTGHAHFSMSDLETAGELGRRMAIALDNACMYSEARQCSGRAAHA